MNEYISDEELLTDIKNTEKESLAYLKISEGFNILSSLPENSPHFRIFKMECGKYINKYKECKKLQEKLERIATDRGLKR